jgi:hypothetical protein
LQSYILLRMVPYNAWCRTAELVACWFVYTLLTHDEKSILFSRANLILRVPCLSLHFKSHDRCAHLYTLINLNCLLTTGTAAEKQMTSPSRWQSVQDRHRLQKGTDRITRSPIHLLRSRSPDRRMLLHTRIGRGCCKLSRLLHSPTGHSARGNRIHSQFLRELSCDSEL